MAARVSSVDFTPMIDSPGRGLIKSVDARLVPDRAWAAGRNIRFYRRGTRVRKIDGFSLYDTTPGNEPVRFLWHYVKSDGSELLVRVGTTKAWTGAGTTRVEIGSGLAGTSTLPVLGDQFKDDLIWTDGQDRVQRYSGGGAGSVVDLPGFTANRSKIVLSHKQHVHHFNVTEGGVVRPWRDIYSAVGDPTDYVGATAGDLDFLETPGAITAAGILGEAIIVHKGETTIGSLHRMLFVGAPDKYIQEPIPADDAAIARGALLKKGAFQYYMGHRNFYRLGAFPEPIGDDIWPEIIDELGQSALLDYAQRHRIFCYQRPEWQEIAWKIPRVSSLQPDLTVIHNTRDGTWSITDHDPGLCYGLFPAIVTDTWDAGVSATWDTSPDVPWDFSAYTQTLPLALFGQLDGSVQSYGGMNANGVAIAAYLESRVFDRGFEPARIIELLLRAKGTGTLTVKLRSWMDERQTVPAFPAGSTYALTGSTKPTADVKAYGRLWQVRLEQSALNEDFELAGYAPGVLAGGGIR